MKYYSLGKCDRCDRPGLVIRNPFFGLNACFNEEWLCVSCLTVMLLLVEPAANAKAEDAEAKFCSEIYKRYADHIYEYSPEHGTQWGVNDHFHKVVRAHARLGLLVRDACGAEKGAEMEPK